MSTQSSLKIDYINPITKGTDLSVGTTSQFGQRIYNGKQEFHAGLDYKTKSSIHLDGKVPVYAMAGGKVVRAENCPNGVGTLVSIQHENGQVSNYFHLTSSTVKLGDVIKQGDPIAVAGNTGRGSGPHLHIAIAEGKSAQKIINAQGTATFGVNAKLESNFISPLEADTSNGKSKQPTPSGDTPISPLLQKAIDAERASQAGLEGQSSSQSQADGQLQTGQESQSQSQSQTDASSSTPSALSTFSSGVMESMQNQFKSSMPTIIARLALGEDLDKICLDMAARITLSSVTDQALVQAGISSLFFYTNIKNITKSIDNVICINRIKCCV